MAEKYKSWDKTMLSFTVPSSIRGKTIKRGRYTKLKYLIEIRAYIAKLISNMDDVKYFMNIELGKAYSNPHLHIQLWTKNKVNPKTAILEGAYALNVSTKGQSAMSQELTKPVCVSQNTNYVTQNNLSTISDTQNTATSSNIANLIHNKTAHKFNLQSDRCFITYPEKDIDVYSYVIKDYLKGLSDKELWNLEIQKKRMRDQIGSKVRFYSKSGDKYTKKIYRIVYKYYSCVRKYANEFIEKFISMFFIKNIPQQKCLELYLSKLCRYRTRKIIDLSVFPIILIFDVFCCCRDPPLHCALFALCYS